MSFIIFGRSFIIITSMYGLLNNLILTGKASVISFIDLQPWVRCIKPSNLDLIGAHVEDLPKALSG